MKYPESWPLLLGGYLGVQGMRFIRRTALVGVVLAAATHYAWALDFKPVTSSSAAMPFVVVSGEFGTNEPLAGFLEAVTQSGAKVVTFDSPGGNVLTAIQLGRMIRALGLDTLQVRQMECASACSLAFMGGVKRFADPGSIGVHRSSFSSNAAVSTDDAVAGVQALTANIISYLNDMGVDPKLLAVALSYDKSDIRYLSASEMAELRVTNMDVAQASASTPPAESPSPPQAEAKVQNDELERAAVTFVRRLIEQHGDDAGLAIAQVVASYAPQVNYYGKPKDLSEVVADKRGYFQRWPERGYRIRDGSVMVTCANDTCMVSGTYDWIVRSLPRSKQAKGVARFSYTIAIGANPKVIAEAGEVVR